jgi:hypothetical protein
MNAGQPHASRILGECGHSNVANCKYIAHPDLEEGAV